MSSDQITTQGALDAETAAAYRRAMFVLQEANVPFLVGGAYAFERYAGIGRHTKDFDLFVHPRDIQRALRVLEGAGYYTEMTFPHWLGKAFARDHMVDLIFSSGNGIARVDDLWFEHAVPEEVLGVKVDLCPAEEMIWSKGYIMERERFDGGDVAHLLRSCAARLDWDRLLNRFGDHWRVLLSHLVLYGFIYPGERHRIPGRVMQTLLRRLEAEVHAPQQGEAMCQGTLLSRAQYLVDVHQWHYRDVRLHPYGPLSRHDVDQWTAGIAEDGERA